MAYLILMRHGQSEWNEKGLWTGLTDIDLTEAGRKEAKAAAHLIQDVPIDIAYTSNLRRAQETLAIVIASLHLLIPVHRDDALNERDYGDYTGKNKWDIEKEVGKETFRKIRRAWDYPLPHGESLKKVSERTIPYFQTHILPQLKTGKNVLVVAHGNSLRTIIKYMEHISNEDIANVEIKTGHVVLYDIDTQGNMLSKKTIPEP